MVLLVVAVPIGSRAVYFFIPLASTLMDGYAWSLCTMHLSWLVPSYHLMPKRKERTFELYGNRTQEQML